MASETYELVICPVGPENPRNSEASIVELKDGKLLLAYSDFYGGERDDSPGRISGKISEDGGRTWIDRFTLQQNDAEQNVMSASLLRLQSGEIALFWGHKNAPNDLKFYVKKSFDEGKSWTGPACVTPVPGYHVMNNDRALQLSSGRLLAPVSFCPVSCWSKEAHYTSFCFYSDDKGESWREGEVEVDLPNRGAMEPGLVELRDKSVMMIIRTQLGRIYRSYSCDGGLSWADPKPMELISPESPATLKRIPLTGDLLMIWNNNPEAETNYGARRAPLTSAISDDEGKSWRNFRNIEPDSGHTYAYTSVAFVGEVVVMTYYLGHPDEGWSLKLRIADVGWFYE